MTWKKILIPRHYIVGGKQHTYHIKIPNDLNFSDWEETVDESLID